MASLRFAGWFIMIEGLFCLMLGFGIFLTQPQPGVTYDSDFTVPWQYGAFAAVLGAIWITVGVFVRHGHRRALWAWLLGHALLVVAFIIITLGLV